VTNRAELLCDMDRRMLKEFHRRTLEGLRRHTLFQLLARPLREFYELNIRKEAERQRYIILHAAGLIQADKFPTQLDTQHLLSVARDIDRAYLQVPDFQPVPGDVQQADIDPLRLSVIQGLLNESHQLLQHWQAMRCLRNALAMQYDTAQFAKLLYDLLHFHAQETRLLGQYVRLPAVTVLMRESLIETGYLVMQAAARSLSQQAAAELLAPRELTLA